MNTEEFLAHVLPAVGPYVVAKRLDHIPNKPFQHLLADTVDDAAAAALSVDKQGKNVYFAVGSLKQGRIEQPDGRLKISRAATNIRALRSYILDIDVRTEGGQYTTIESALQALIEFVRSSKLPKPTVVNSGGGLHVYWTLQSEVTAEEFASYGEALKSLAITHGMRIDGSRTADAASVLRVVGTHNYKYSPAPLVHVLAVGKSTPTEQLHSLLSLRSPTAGILATHGPPPVSLADVFGSNTNRYEDVVLDLRKLRDNCQAFRYTIDPNNQRQGAAAIPEPAWKAAMGLAVYAKNHVKAAHLISSFDPRYNAQYVDTKIVQFRNFGPSTCAQFQKAYEGTVNADCCNGCPSRGAIGSPASIAKYVAKAAPIVVSKALADGTVVPHEIPDPPAPFVRTPKGMGVEVANPKTRVNEVVVFCDYDLYPTRLRVDERTNLEDDVQWRVKLPKEDWIDITIPHVNRQQLGTTLAKRSMYIDEANIPHMANFMTAYTRRLQNEIPREVAFSKLGFRKNGEFVLGHMLYKPDGTSEEHSISRALRNTTNDGVVTSGDYETWQDQVALYARQGNEAHRSYIYSAFASVLYHLTGHVATCVSASGPTGVGKSTLMDVCASIWGDPARLVVRGGNDGSTRAAAEVLSDALHNLPVMMDEITGRDAKDVAALIFNYSGGKGKIRSTAQGGIRNDTATWSNLLLVNANTDEYERMSSVFRDSSQHMVRLVQIEFSATHSVSKAEGDALRRAVCEHYGWAGHLFAAHVSKNYADIKKRVRSMIDTIDAKVHAKSEERFWTAWAACAIIAGEIAVDLGILRGFPLAHDADWIVNQINRIRVNVQSHMPVASEVLAEFLDAHLGATLTIGAKGASNIDNIIGEPTRELSVRYEVDTHTCFINRSVFRQYCVESGVNFNRTLVEMTKKKVLVRDNVLKVLGTGTQYAKGRIRCIEIDTDALGGKPALTAVPAAAIVSLPATGTAN